MPAKRIVIDQHSLRQCPDCFVNPGEIHKAGCHVEKCSHCGHSRAKCIVEEHDPAFARWTGFWPGEIEAKALGLTTAEFYKKDAYKPFLIKPKLKAVAAS